MGDFVKSKLKELKQAVGSKDWSAVEKHAESVLSFESNNYNARVFLALALFNLEKFDQSHETYLKAIEQNPSQLLARQGLVAFYEKRQRWQECDRALNELLDVCRQAQDATKYAETLQKLIDVRRAHGSKEELIQVLSLLLPSSPTRPLLDSLPPAAPTAPTATPFHSIQLAITSPLPTLLELTSLVEQIESDKIEKEVSKRRQRLGGPTLSAIETRHQVEFEFMKQSQLPLLYKTVLQDSDASHDDELRRKIEKKLLIHFKTLLKSCPSSWDETKIDLTTGSINSNSKTIRDQQKIQEQDEFKNSVRNHVEQLARDMVLIGVVEPMAWQVVIEWQDEFANWDNIDWSLLSKHVEAFPEDGLSLIAGASHQRIEADKQRQQLSKEEPDASVDQVPESIISAPDDDEMNLIIEKGLASSPDSVVAHLLSLHFYVKRQEWDAVVQIAEAGLSVVQKIQVEIGRGLNSSRQEFETRLAIALVYHESPNHHLRALRMLETLLTSDDEDIELLIAKTFVLQSSEQWNLAIKTWDKVLNLFDNVQNVSDSTIQNKLLQATSERGWSLYNNGQFIEATQALETVVEQLEQRKKQRDEEQRKKENARSKIGATKEQGVEEGETSQEAQERARGDRPEAADEAYDAFINSLKARNDFASSFTSLGMYYRCLKPEPDFERSSKCFQKAFELDGGEEIAAKYLAQDYALVHEWSLVETVARRVVANNQGKAALGMKAAKRLAWAYKAIGGSELTFKHYPQAITAFQAALRGEPDDVSSWIKLGVAYRHSGKHVAALKVFSKALNLDSESWYAKFSIGDVQRDLGLFEAAISTFRSILDQRPDELGVQVVLAETALSQGLEQFRTGFTARSEQSLIEALGFAVQIVEAGTATRIGLKVAADCLSTLGKIQDGSNFEEAKQLAARLQRVLMDQDVDSKMTEISIVTTTIAETVLEQYDVPAVLLVVVVLVCKMRTLLEVRRESMVGSAWFDLGVSISTLRPHLDSLGLTDTSTDQQALHQAVKSLKSALQDEPMNSVFWNALGVLTFDLSPRLSQHCFIKSIEYNSRTAIPWTNLGLFYLVQGDDELANQSFLKAQVIDSDWAQAWVGQATLADMANHVNESNMLLEHAVSLGATTPEADILHASRSFDKFVKMRTKQLYENGGSDVDTIEPTEALSGPLFSITRYLTRFPQDPTALHLNALMLEQVGDRMAACESLERAAIVLEQLYELDESSQVEAQFVIAQTNLGRIRLSVEDYSGAADAFEAALSLLDIEQVRDQVSNTGQVTDDDNGNHDGGLTTSQTLLLWAECKLGLGYSHHFLGEFSSAEEILESALDDLDGIPGSKRSALAVALGRVYWAEGEEEHARAAFLDAPDSVVERSPLFVKLALHALAIVTSDKVILATAQRMAMTGRVKYNARNTELSVLQHLVKHDFTGALSTICRTLHAKPWETENRRRLGKNLLQFPTTSTTTTNNLLPLTDSPNLAICARFMRTKVSKWQPSEQVADRLRGVAIARLKNEGGEFEALKFSEKGLFVSPWSKPARKVVETIQKAFE
ncbi:Superkiller protein 3 [Microbotryomycetes sp. JL221]|nr:Superkiller protein 3 [Microbotryomycetes sp. JL221]